MDSSTVPKAAGKDPADRHAVNTTTADRSLYALCTASKSLANPRRVSSSSFSQDNGLGNATGNVALGNRTYHAVAFLRTALGCFCGTKGRFCGTGIVHSVRFDRR
jgi:hypothetical protein